MGIRQDMKTLAVLFLLLALSCAQDNKKYDSFAWRPMKLQRHPSSNLPYHQPEATTSSYDSRFFDSSAPFHGSTRFYPDTPSSPFGPADSYDSYSPDFPKHQPYHYPEDSGSYEQYGQPTRDDNFNITMERYGGFGGTGDTRGFGAYDYPRKVHDDVPQELHRDDEPKIDTSFPDLMRLGRERFHRERNPHHMHPLPPPL